MPKMTRGIEAPGIRSERVLLRVTASELGRLAGIGRATVSKIERGEVVDAICIQKAVVALLDVAESQGQTARSAVVERLNEIKSYAEDIALGRPTRRHEKDPYSLSELKHNIDVYFEGRKYNQLSDEKIKELKNILNRNLDLLSRFQLYREAGSQSRMEPTTWQIHSNDEI